MDVDSKSRKGRATAEVNSDSSVSRVAEGDVTDRHRERGEHIWRARDRPGSLGEGDAINLSGIGRSSRAGVTDVDSPYPAVRRSQFAEDAARKITGRTTDQ